MKKLLISIFILFFCFSVHAGVIIGNYYAGISGCAGYIGGKTDTGGSEGATSSTICGVFTQSGTCTVNTIQMYVHYDSGAANVKLGLYDVSSGDPNNLLGQSGAIATGSGYAWVGSANNMGSNITLTDGNDYFLCFIADATVYYMYDTVTSGDSYQCGGACTYADAMENPFDTVNGSDYTRTPAIRLSSQ